MEELFLGVMELQEAKNHQLELKARGVEVELKVNSTTCTSGCKVTVEVWGKGEDKEKIESYLSADYLKHVRGHEPDLNSLSSVFDESMSEVLCQACGAKFSPQVKICPDCGLVYF